MNFLGELRWFCSGESSSVLACMHVAELAAKGHKLKSLSERAGGGWVGDGQRDDKEVWENKKMRSFYATDAPISQSALDFLLKRVRCMAPPRGGEKK